MGDQEIRVEKKSDERLVVFTTVLPITYGYDKVSDMLLHLQRLVAPPPKQMFRVRRCLYGMQMLYAVNTTVLKMVQMQATDVYRDYWFIQMPNSCALYVEELENSLHVFMVSGGEDAGFAVYAGLIRQ